MQHSLRLPTVGDIKTAVRIKAKERGVGKKEKNVTARVRAAEVDKAAGRDKTDNHNGGIIMPGFNQTGPMNEGPMTGGGRGICTHMASPGQRFAGRDVTEYGQGAGRRRGKRGCQGYGRGIVTNIKFEQQPVQAAATKESLKNRAKFLEGELASIKKELLNLSESDA
ncbi:MAG: DUF5320 domain-containing protein [Desulfobacula sp.]|nr:DUF5320 domain-containing protein [Desulfobacula sp.]